MPCSAHPTSRWPLALSLFACALSGCATAPSPVVSGTSVEDQALMHSVQQVERTTALLRTAMKPYEGFPTPSPTARPEGADTVPLELMHTRINFQWDGDAAVALKSIADRLGFVFINSHVGEPYRVNLAMQDVTVRAVLDDVARQLPDTVVVRLIEHESGSGTIKMEDK